MGVLQDVHKKDRTDAACIARRTARRSDLYVAQRDAELRHARSDGMVHGGMQWYAVVCGVTQWHVVVSDGMQWYSMVYDGMWWYICDGMH